MTDADSITEQGMRLSAQRAKIEVELLASIADAPRAAVAILSRLGVSVAHFAEEDTTRIYLVLEVASRMDGPPMDKAKVGRLCRKMLEAAHQWDNNDDREYVAGPRWGPGPLAALLSRVKFDPALVEAKARELIELDMRERELRAGQ